MTNDINLKIILANRFQGDAHWNYKDVVYPYNTLYFVLGGDGHIRLNGKTTDMIAGNVYLIPPMAVHDIWCDTHVEKVYINLHAELLPGYDVFSGEKEILKMNIGLDRCKRIYDLCCDGMKEWLSLKGEIYLAISDLISDEVKPASAKMISLMPIISEMHNHLSAQIRRDDIASKYGWNPSVLSRTFKQVFGCGIKEYAQGLLIARLVEELLLTDKTLRQLADEYSFCDAFYMSAFFKRNIGVSPTEYRKKHQQPRNK